MPRRVAPARAVSDLLCAMRIDWPQFTLSAPHRRSAAHSPAPFPLLSSSPVMSGRWGGSERDREKHRESERQREKERTVAREADRDARHGGPASSAQSASAAVNRPIVVQLDGLVLLKIIAHSRESLPEVVSGQLLGLDIGQKLEVTNCFPFPLGLSEADSDAYQLEMMKHLRTINVDNNTVGWYQSAYLGTFFDQGQHTHRSGDGNCARIAASRTSSLCAPVLTSLSPVLFSAPCGQACSRLNTPTKSTFRTVWWWCTIRSKPRRAAWFLRPTDCPTTSCACSPLRALALKH